MKHWKMYFNETRIFSPISVWVHKLPKGISSNWSDSKVFEPPFPQKIVLKGFPYLEVTVFNINLYFSSKYEVIHCIEIMQQKNLPSTKNLIQSSATRYSGYNHWLATLPKELKSWKKREKIVKILQNTLDEIKNCKINF